MKTTRVYNYYWNYFWRSSVLLTGSAILVTLIAPPLSRLEAPQLQTDAAALISTSFLLAALALLTLAVVVARRQVRMQQQSEEMFRSLVESAQDPMFTLDAAGRYLYVNPVSAARLGKTHADVAGRRVDEFFGPEAGTHFRELVTEALRTGQPSTTEVTFEINRQRFWSSVLVQRIRDPDGGYTRALAISR